MNLGNILDWGRYVQVLRAHWRALLIAFLLSLPIGFGLARLIPMQYTATMEVTAARYTSDTKPLTQTGVASLLNPQAGQLTDFALYLKLLDSFPVAERIFNDHPTLVRQIFANQWSHGRWVPPDTWRQKLRDALYSVVGATAWEPPTPLTLKAYLANVSITADRQDPVATITVSNKSRKLAIEILTVIHHEAEYILKTQAERRSAVKAKFLTRLLRNSHLVDVAQTVASEAVRNEISAAISKAPVPFAAEFISPPNAPMLPDQKPRIFAPFVISALVAVIVFFVFFFFYDFNSVTAAWQEGPLRTLMRLSQKRRREPISHLSGD
ncbi:MAG: hypothetical protein ACP5QR_17135 [Rhizomicrobium sp.]